MRLLYVIDSLAPGGAETSLAAMAPGLIKSGIELHVLPLGSRHDLAAHLEDAGATVHRQIGNRGRIGNVRVVIDTARRIRPSLIHTTLFEADVSGRLAARVLGVPSSTSIVNDSYGPSHYAESSTAKLHAARLMDASTARFSTHFHAITDAIARSVPPRLGIPLDRVQVIPRGRDPLQFPMRTAQVRQSNRSALDIRPGQPVILSVGRLEPQKGHHHLLSALPAVAHTHPDVVTLVVGKEGRASARLRSHAAELGLDIRFLGHQEDIPGLLAAADVFCFPSEREGFGGVLLEAMAVGCPIVASSIPTTREVLWDGSRVSGLLVQATNSDALGRAINQVLDDESLAQECTRAGRARFEREFTTESVALRMVRFFEKASQKNPSAETT